MKKNIYKGTSKNTISSFSIVEKAGDEVVKKRIFRGAHKIPLVFGILLMFISGGCSKDKWDKHYDETAGRNNMMGNILTGLRQKGYNEFAAALEKLKLDSAFNSGMQYTIFALTDEAFRQSAGNFSDYDLSFFVLNHIFGGKSYSSSFNNKAYRALAGNVFYITNDSISNFYNEWVKFTNKDIEIPNAVVFELAKSINIYPNLFHDFPSYYPFFYSFYKDSFIPNTVEYPQILGVTSSGLTIDSVYLYNKIFTLTKTSNHLTFVVNKDYAENAYNQQMSKLLPYFIGGEDVITNDVNYYLRRKNVILNIAYNGNKDSLILDNLYSDHYKLPLSKVNQIICDNGNKLLVVDTLFYHNYTIGKNKFITLPTSKYKTSGSFKNFGGSNGTAVIWNSTPQSGDYIEFSFPADSIYTKPYDLKLDYKYKDSYAAVKIYVDGDSLQNRFDLGSTVGATPVGNLYRYFIASNFLIKKYQVHTIRLEVVGTKGNATEIMDVRKLNLGLKD